MKVTKDYSERELTMAVEGRVDTITSRELEGEITSEIGSFDALIMDFENLEYISSAGLRVLIATQKRLNESDGTLIITNANDAVCEIFAMSGLDKVITIE